MAEVYQFYVADTSKTYPYEELPMVCALHGKTSHVDNLEIHQDERNIPIESWGTPIYDNDGKVIYSLTAFQNITERKQAEAVKIRLIQEREAKNVALRYSKEIEAKNIVSKEEIVELSGLIREASAKMSTLIMNLLDVNQIESGNIRLNFTHVDILPIVESIAQDYAKRAKKKDINLYFSYDGNDFQAYVDANAVVSI